MNAELLVRLRREKNRLKWGEQNWPDGTGPTHERLLERTRARERVDAGLKSGAVTYFEILREEFLEVACEEKPELVLAELIDVAAVAQDWIDAILRRSSRQLERNPPKIARPRRTPSRAVRVEKVQP